MARNGYVVELSASASDARRSDALVLGTKADVVRALELEFLNPDDGERALAAELSIRAGELLVAWVVKEGEVVARVELRPFVRVGFPGAKRGVLLSNDKGIAAELARLREHGADFEELGLAFAVDSKPLESALPALGASVVKPGDPLEIPAEAPLWDESESCLKVAEGPLPWGYHDLEGSGENGRIYFEEAFPVDD
ncbi:MAG: hypothetical protein ACAI25_20300 [Planctomycetota bacterium]